ncbi:MAG: MFS transporter [Calditrichaeota bacterium]|nr:MAG: MFS transporter [Calditrichota bacterium]
MLARFCAYGFLKNQRYFEPFIVLALLEKNLSFFQVGTLFAFRELMVNFAEIPSGSIADIYGRRRSMIVSFVAYILSFLVFAVSVRYSAFFIAMLFYAIGDAFRTGTHKAMIFSWLRSQGKENERLRYYGLTRSWSKLGSALSAIISGFFVFYFKEYTAIFYFSCIPYIVSIINIASYPAELDGSTDNFKSVRQLFLHTKDGLAMSLKSKYLRHLIFESMGFEGVFNSMKDYLQPVLQTLAAGVLIHFAFANELTSAQKSVIFVVPTYTVLFIMSAVVSRNAQKIIQFLGEEYQAAFKCWGLFAAISLIITMAGFYRSLALVAIAFILLFMLQNLWRPFLVSRFDSHSTEAHGATILSIESQSRRVATVVLAPILGFMVDYVRENQLIGEYGLVGFIGILSAVLFLYFNHLFLNRLNNGIQN